MGRSSIEIILLGCVLIAAFIGPARAQFASWALKAAASAVHATSASEEAAPAFIQPGITLPRCPNTRVLQTQGVPDNWHTMSLEEQVAHPINALMLQLAYVPWQNDPKATLSSCLSNLGIDLDSVSILHKIVLPYLGTMTAVVMRAGDKGVFVSFRGTDFDDRGDVLVDADCQYTDNKARMFGSSRNVRLHTGFYRAYESVAPTMVNLVAEQLPKTSTQKVYFIGHSLGGSMAAIAALRFNHLLRHNTAQVGGVWLFGCPRVGNQAWMQEYNSKLLGHTLRMANFGDFASRLPMETQICPSARILSNFEFRHVGRSLVLCPDSHTGLAHWELHANGSEVLDCGPVPDSPDFTVSTHWLGPYLDAWRRAHMAALGVDLSADPHITSMMCQECSLSFPTDRAKQLNVPARAGGPIGCCTSASCNERPAWDAVATIGSHLMRSFNPLSTCAGFICT